MKKKLRIAGLSYVGMSLLSTLFYCSCTSGSFYTLSTGEYMMEQRLDRQFIASTECRYSPDACLRPGIPVYRLGDKYYVAAERVTLRRNIRILSSVGSAPDTSCINYYGDEEKMFYEVEKITSAGEISFSVPSGKGEGDMPVIVQAVDDLPRPESNQAGAPAFICRIDTRASLPRLVSLPDGTPHTLAYLSGVPARTIGKDGSTQLMLTPIHDELSWRSIYALPSAAVLFVAVDIPFDIISFTGFCIRSLFD